MAISEVVDRDRKLMLLISQDDEIVNTFMEKKSLHNEFDAEFYISEQYAEYSQF